MLLFFPSSPKSEKTDAQLLKLWIKDKNDNKKKKILHSKFGQLHNPAKKVNKNWQEDFTVMFNSREKILW